jgi:predicted lipoprotein with Yx(FWY)xxD motif
METATTKKRRRRTMAMWAAPAVIAAGGLAAGVAVLAPASASTAKSPAAASTAKARALPSTKKTEIVVRTEKTRKYGTILVDTKGFTLYTYAKDTKDHSRVTGELLSFWPALVVRAGVTPVGKHVSGIGFFTRSNGQHQVTDHGKPLYLFVSDTKPGQVTGQGVSGFSVVRVHSSATSSAGVGPSSSTSSPSGGWGGY